MRRLPRAARQSGGYDAKSEPARETIDTADPDVSAEREDDKLSPQGSGTSCIGAATYSSREACGAVLAVNHSLASHSIMRLLMPSLVACLFVCAPMASNAGSGILHLEKSTDGLANWVKIPITSELLTVNGDVDIGALPAGGNRFYRMKILVDESAVAGMVRVFGGTLPQGSPLSGAVVPTFYIAKYEVTWREWQVVRSYAVANEYDLADIGAGSDTEHPVEMVNWYDAAKWCNAKSQMEGLTPVYLDGETIYKTGEVVPSVVSGANGYRLPSEAEWEWAARGGPSSQGFTFSGNNEAAIVAWFADNNSPNAGTKAVGMKAANELRVYDMSGNVVEWCGDSSSPYGFYPSIRGGAYDYPAVACTVSAQGSSVPHNRAGNFGFRLARSTP